jgi:hypothetical protein
MTRRRATTLFSLIFATLTLGACRTKGPAPVESPSVTTVALPGAAPAAVPAPTVAAAAPSVASAPGKIALTVTEEGFVPDRIPAKKGKPLTLSITRKTDHTCAREIMFQGQDGKTPLPLGKTVDVTYTPKASGELKFGCAMGMMVSGVMAVSE